MNELFKLLESKNYWYTKYLNCTSAYLAALQHAPDIALGELELFYGNRDSLLKILEDLDGKVEAWLAANSSRREATAEERTRIQFLIREKDSIIKSVLSMDEEVIGSLEKLRAEGSEKLKALTKGKKALANYKSTLKHNEKIDKRV